MANQAAWLQGVKQNPFVVEEAPMPTPKPDQIIIRVRATAMNPCDTMIQALGVLVESFPAVLGEDAAGEVSAVGSEVTRFKVGDRAVGFVNTLGDPDSVRGTFQLYTAVPERCASKIPENVSFAQAAVLPLGFQTALIGLFFQDVMGLPSKPQLDPKPNGKTLLVWGASSSVGSCAVQLARAAGYEVFATSSEHNFDYCRELGAVQVFKQRDEKVVDSIIEAFKGKELGGIYDAIIAAETIRACGEIARSVEGGHKYVATVLPGPMMPLPEDLPEDVKFGYTNSGDVNAIETSKAIWAEWLAPALEKGLMKCRPEPEIIGQGLEKIQDACDKLLQGVSATKLVVELP